ncbi:Hypothetical protein FKW44_001524 [Caligus rogercresseyi]|uniref:Uncharacterized protein n=1 Tax=Caligus rogercresseyi TaxID=217165 RepID=A0A7T8KIV1_CALRO|nr:Hypothetical protein FKW44_001524 [Caligus rogercresseyi]
MSPSPSLYAAPVVKNPPRKAHKDPVTSFGQPGEDFYQPPDDRRRFALSECF